jgi:hypothetical protein
MTALKGLALAAACSNRWFAVRAAPAPSVIGTSWTGF